MPDLFNGESFINLAQSANSVPVSVARDSQRNPSASKYATYEKIYDSYAGVDIVALLLLPNEPKPLVLGELQTISYSMHRESTPVRTLGHVNPRGFVRGPRTLAGSLIFTQFDQYAFYRLHEYQRHVGNGLFPLADMMPPFDIVLSFANESGSFSKMKILSITIIDEGGTMSVDDLITEQTYTYMARGIEPLVSYVPDDFEGLYSTETPTGRRTRKAPTLGLR